MSTPTKRPLLFISHASEDKADFVAPLAKRLQQLFDVWYDDFTLRLGDSLLQRIDDGLAKCDFAVVVLSKAFFAKEWTNKELSGLVAGESHKENYSAGVEGRDGRAGQKLLSNSR